MFAELLALLDGQLGDDDDALELAVAKHPDAHVCTSLPSVGPTTASTLLAEMGEDRGYYPDVGMLLAEAGLAPVTRSSGRSHRVRFRCASNTRLRETCMWRAYDSVKTSPWARDAYDRARARKHTTVRHVGSVPAGCACSGEPGPTASPTTRTCTPSDSRR